MAAERFVSLDMALASLWLVGIARDAAIGCGDGQGAAAAVIGVGGPVDGRARGIRLGYAVEFSQRGTGAGTVLRIHLRDGNVVVPFDDADDTPEAIESGFC